MKISDTNTLKGFTLIELVVVILILSIGLGFLAPKISSGLFVNEKKSFLRKLHGALQEARNQAMLSGGPVSLTFQLKTGVGREYFWLNTHNQDTNPKREPQKISVPEHLDIVSIITPKGVPETSGPVKFIFLPNGLNLSGIINFKDDENYFHIIIKPFARMEVASGKVTQ